MKFLTQLIGDIVGPILDKKFSEWEAKIISNHYEVRKFKEYDEKAIKHIENGLKASTTEEAKAHLQRLYNDRATLDV